MMPGKPPPDHILRSIAELLEQKMDPALYGLSASKLADVLRTVGSSAPRAPRREGERLERWQDAVIVETVPEGASVLDLGCGRGELLHALIDTRRVRGQGVERDAEAVIACVERGVPVFQADLDEGLKGWPDGAFDYVVLEETLQTLLRPVEVLGEMLRVGRRGIVSFPNFAYWRVRLDLAVRGRMPVTEWLPYRWYDTPNIHLLTLQDFFDWADSQNVNIIQGAVLCEGEIRPLRPGDNLAADEALLVVEKR
jgi:methionine biosynthesis protein MetW